MARMCQLLMICRCHQVHPTQLEMSILNISTTLRCYLLWEVRSSNLRNKILSQTQSTVYVGYLALVTLTFAIVVKGRIQFISREKYLKSRRRAGCLRSIGLYCLAKNYTVRDNIHLLIITERIALIL